MGMNRTTVWDDTPVSFQKPSAWSRRESSLSLIVNCIQGDLFDQFIPLFNMLAARSRTTATKHTTGGRENRTEEDDRWLSECIRFDLSLQAF